jgi:phytoene dehydrogenase-like protein
MTLQWATYYDAADEAGISRIWGGIHPPIDNVAGRRVGSEVGKDVWALAKRYFDGSVRNTPVTITRLNSTDHEVRYDALRGFYYSLQSTLDLNQPFTDDPPGTSQPFDALSVARTNTFSGTSKFYRAISRDTP